MLDTIARHELETTERRKAPRRIAAITVLVGEERHEAPVRDVTTQGLSFVFPCELRPGTGICVEFCSFTSGAVFLKGARVIHSTERRAGEWLIGVLFPHPLNETDLLTIVSK